MIVCVLLAVAATLCAAYSFFSCLLLSIQLVGVVVTFLKSENSDETYSNVDLIRFVSNFGWQWIERSGKTLTK